MKIADIPGDIIVTHALGSCLGIAAYDPEIHLGGIFHVMLPTCMVSPERAKDYPLMFVDLGTPLFFKSLFQAGGEKERLIVKVAGGAAFDDSGPSKFFDIGKKNLIMLKKLFRKNGIEIAGEDTGGSKARTMYLQIGTGRVWLQSDLRIQDL